MKYMFVVLQQLYEANKEHLLIDELLQLAFSLCLLGTFPECLVKRIFNLDFVSNIDRHCEGRVSEHHETKIFSLGGKYLLLHLISY